MKLENMSEFNFKSSPCTSREQSERLLALGLKKETADCYWWQENDQYGDGNGKWHLEVLDTKEAREHFEYLDKIFDDELFIPAWSLDRLRELIPENIFTGVRNQWCRVMYNGILTYEEGDDSLVIFREENIYNRCISCIEWLIKEGYFPKEYLEE